MVREGLVCRFRIYGLSGMENRICQGMYKFLLNVSNKETYEMVRECFGCWFLGCRIFPNEELDDSGVFCNLLLLFLGFMGFQEWRNGSGKF